MKVRISIWQDPVVDLAEADLAEDLVEVALAVAEVASAAVPAEVDLEVPAVFTVDLVALIIAARVLATVTIIARASLVGDPVIMDMAVADALAVSWAP